LFENTGTSAKFFGSKLFGKINGGQRARKNLAFLTNRSIFSRNKKKGRSVLGKKWGGRPQTNIFSIISAAEGDGVPSTCEKHGRPKSGSTFSGFPVGGGMGPWMSDADENERGGRDETRRGRERKRVKKNPHASYYSN